MVAEEVAETLETIGQSSREDTFLRLIEQFEPALRRLAAAYLDREADREDLFQEIALALWQAIPRFRREASERTWLYRIAHNIAISSSAKAYRRGRAEGPIPETFEPPSSSANAEQAILRDESRRALLNSIRRLAATDRQMILLHFEGLSYKEIQEVTGLTEAAIATRLTRIRAKLKEEIRRREVGKQ
jgi:RNA polymerase sigma factor (sigma-70 family)